MRGCYGDASDLAKVQSVGCVWIWTSGQSEWEAGRWWPITVQEGGIDWWNTGGYKKITVEKKKKERHAATGSGGPNTQSRESSPAVIPGWFLKDCLAFLDRFISFFCLTVSRMSVAGLKKQFHKASQVRRRPGSFFVFFPLLTFVYLYIFSIFYFCLCI